MQAWTYPAVLDRQDGEIIVRLPDFPEALTGAETVDEALVLAADALEEAVLAYLDAGHPIPSPRDASKGEKAVPLDPSTAARVLLSQAMAEQNLTKVGLAERLGKDEKVVRRILSGKEASLTLTLEALRAMGIRPALAV